MLRVDWSPVSTQTQSLALHALRLDGNRALVIKPTYFVMDMRDSRLRPVNSIQWWIGIYIKARGVYRARDKLQAYKAESGVGFLEGAAISLPTS